MLLKKKNKSEDNAMVEEEKEKIVMKAKVKVEKGVGKGLRVEGGRGVGCGDEWGGVGDEGVEGGESLGSS